MPAHHRIRPTVPLLLAVVLLSGLLPSPRTTYAAEPLSPAAPMNFSRAEHTATALADGRVLVVGGYYGVHTSTALQTLATAEIYDPAADRWRLAAPLAAPRQRHTATLLRDGRVLVVGGAGKGGQLLTATATAEIYDPVADRWAATGALHTTRWDHQAIVLADGRIMVVGGREQVFGGSYTSLATAEIYDPAAGTWAVARPMGEPRFGHAAATLTDGRVLVVGGRNRDNSRNLQTAEIYDPATDRWMATAPPGGFVAGPLATRLPDGEVLITGTDEPLRYDSKTDRWAAAGRPLTRFPLLRTATLLPGGAVLVIGTGEGGATAERYDPITEEWTAAGNPTVTGEHTATPLQDGRVLIAGGRGNLPAPPQQRHGSSQTPHPRTASPRPGAASAGASSSTG